MGRIQDAPLYLGGKYTSSLQLLVTFRLIWVVLPPAVPFAFHVCSLKIVPRHLYMRAQVCSSPLIISNDVRPGRVQQRILNLFLNKDMLRVNQVYNQQHML